MKRKRPVKSVHPLGLFALTAKGTVSVAGVVKKNDHQTAYKKTPQLVTVLAISMFDAIYSSCFI